MKILNIGSCNIDYVYSMDHIVEVGETETTDSLEIFAGGKGLNQSVAVAKAGAKVYHAGCIGCDGDMLLDILKENGVDVSFLHKSDEKNGHAIIQVSSAGDNSIFIYPGSNHTVTKAYIDSVLSNFSKGDMLLLQNEISNVEYIIERAYQKKMCILLNPSPFDEKMKKFDYNLVSYLILNEVEVREITGCDDVEESIHRMKTKYPELKVMLTLGSKGCIYFDAQQHLRQSAYKVKVVDTTAAGDTFTGYFTAELSRGKPMREILGIASAASAIAVSRKGAAPSVPHMEEVLASFAKMEENKSDANEELKRRIEQYIQAHIKDAKLEELAKKLGYSAVYTGRLVRKVTGVPFSKAVQSRRCAYAAELLLNTKMSVAEIIESVGYENESFFRTVFKNKYGKNPLEFRKQGVK